MGSNGPTRLALIRTLLLLIVGGFFAGACSAGTSKESEEIGKGTIATGWSQQFTNTLHPYILFMNGQELPIAENRLVAKCMRERGWDKYPLMDRPDSNGEVPQLSTVQTVEERERMARAYGQSMQARPVFSASRQEFDAFSDWLSKQDSSSRTRYFEDFSGQTGEDLPAQKGSCRAEALDSLRQTIPIAVAAVEKRALEVFRSNVSQSRGYKLAERNWRACVSEKGFPKVGDPLAVWNPDISGKVGMTANDGPSAGEQARILTQQAIVEHECAKVHLDDVVRRRELQVVEQLVEEFPEYYAIVQP